jgi:hypothetical protein
MIQLSYRWQETPVAAWATDKPILTFGEPELIIRLG